jgi:hypothetical protein
MKYTVKECYYCGRERLCVVEKGVCYYCPFAITFDSLLMKIHSQNGLHLCKNRTVQAFKLAGFNIYGLYSLVENFIGQCLVCIADTSKRIGLYRHKRPHSLINSNPWEILTIDTVQLDKSIVVKTGGKYKYVLTMVEHFSKFAIAYALENKTAALVQSYITKSLDLISLSFGQRP